MPPAGAKQASTFKLDSKLRQLELQNIYLLVKRSASDVISLEAKYHPDCLVNLYRKAALKEYLDEFTKDQVLNCLTFAELTVYIEEKQLADAEM